MRQNMKQVAETQKNQEEQKAPLEGIKQENAIEKTPSKATPRNMEEQAIKEEKNTQEANTKEEEEVIKQENIKEENATTEDNQQEHISYDDFKASLPTSEKKSLSNLERSPLFSKLRSYFSANSPFVTQDDGVVPICIGTISLRYVGERDFCIRTRNKGYKIQRGDVVILPDSAYGRAYERMNVFEKL